MDWLIPLLIGLVIGVVVTWVVGRQASRDSLTLAREQLQQKEELFVKLRQEHEDVKVACERAQAELRHAQKRLEEQQKFVEDIKEQMSDKFAALSQEILRKVMEDAKGDINQKQQAIDNLLKPLSDSLKRYDEQTHALETSLKRDYGSLESHLKLVGESTRQLQKGLFSLDQALRAPQVKGRWGELTLRRIVELSGMTEHCDFTEQVSIDTEDGRLRPDLIVAIPGGGRVVVDSKVPLNAYLDAVEAQSEQLRSEHLRRHAQVVKDHVRRLSAKAYWSQFEKTPDYVVMFISGESFFAAALEVDRGLIEEAMKSRVIVSSPTTLMALLGSIAHGWRQERFAENAEQIRQLGADLYERISKFIENFSGVGRALEQAVASYDRAVGSLERRVLVSARKFRELGATGQDEIEVLEPIEKNPRLLQSELATTSFEEN